MRVRAVAICAGLLTLLAGCSTATRDAYTISMSDVTSSQITSQEVPRYHRVVALANGSAEIIDSLGLKSILVGRDIASTDSSLKSIPIVTSGHQVVAEKIIALNPDLVIIDASVGPSQALDALKSAKIKLATIEEVWAVNAITSKVIAVADAIGAPASGAELASKIAAAIAGIKRDKIRSPRIAFLYLRGGNSIYLLGGKGSGADSLISAIGGVDAGARLSSTPFSPLTSESFSKVNPEIILVMSKGLDSVGGVAGLIALPGIAQSDAGKSERIIAVDDSLLLSFGPRTPDLLVQLAKAVAEVSK